MSIVNVQKDNRYTVEPLYQWDKNQVLEISGLSLPSIPQIHFTNEAMDKAIVRQAAMDGAGVITADVPNSLLQKPYKIKAYVCIYEGDTFETLYAVEIPVKARKKPGDYTLEDDPEVYSFNALENMVYNAVNTLTINHDETLVKVGAKCDETLVKVGAKCDEAVNECNNIASDVDEKIKASIAVESEDEPGCFYRTVDGETEWINPPMIFGTEYRTTERFNGNPVYIKSLKILLTESSPSLEGRLGITPNNVVSYSGVCYAPENVTEMVTSIDLLSNDVGARAPELFYDSGFCLWIPDSWIDTEYYDHYAIITVKYTKE